MAFGAVGSQEFGTYFIGYAATPSVIEQMLQNMFLGKPPASHDRILDFSRGRSGTLFFVPTADFLDDLAAPIDAGPASTTTVPARATNDDGSLGVGDLRPDPATGSNDR